MYSTVCDLEKIKRLMKNNYLTLKSHFHILKIIQQKLKFAIQIISLRNTIFLNCRTIKLGTMSLLKGFNLWLIDPILFQSANICLMKVID